MVDLFHTSAFDLLDRIRDELEEIGEELTGLRIIRHFEIDSFSGVNSRGGEVHGAYFNSRHDRSVSVWVAEFHDSVRPDGLGCKVQLWGKPESGKPDVHHSVRLTRQISVPLNYDSILAAIRDLLPKTFAVGRVPSNSE